MCSHNLTAFGAEFVSETDTGTVVTVCSIRFLGQNGVVGIATRYVLDGPGIESQWGGEGGDFFNTRLKRPWSPHSLLCNRYRVPYLGVMRPEHGFDHPLLAPTLKKE